MKNLKELTDKQLELKLNRAYNSSNSEAIDLIEVEQRFRYMNWEKELTLNTKPSKSKVQHISVGNDENGNEYKRVSTYTIGKGSRTRLYINSVEVVKDERRKCREWICNNGNLVNFTESSI